MCVGSVMAEKKLCQILSGLRVIGELYQYILTIFNGEHQTNIKTLGGPETDDGMNAEKKGGKTSYAEEKSKPESWVQNSEEF